ncbi:hypothetical protein [Azospirillum doebereinerae]
MTGAGRAGGKCWESEGKRRLPNGEPGRQRLWPLVLHHVRPLFDCSPDLCPIFDCSIGA